MSFAEWKKRTKLISFFDMRTEEVEQACKAAYKAGQRASRGVIADAIDNAADGTDKHWICSDCAKSLYKMAKDLRNK